MFQKVIFLLILSFSLLIVSCKKEDNKNLKKEVIINTDMTIYEDSLYNLKNPYYDMFYKLIAKDINAEIDERVQIILPENIKRIGSSFGNEVIEVGSTPLGLGAMFCNSKLVNTLLENGANPYGKINNSNPLTYILQCSEEEQVKMLENYLKALKKYEKNNPDQFKNKTDLAINSKISTFIFKDGISLLNFAVYYNLIESTKLLLKYNVSLDMDENTSTNNPILTALRNRNIEIFNILFNKYPDILNNKIKVNGKDILILDYIFYKGLDREIRKTSSKNLVFFNTIFKPFPKDNESINLIKSLVTKNINNVTVKEEIFGEYTFPIYSTALHISTYFGYRNLIKALTIKGIDVNSQDKLGNTALHVAVMNGYPQISKLLLEAGVNPNIKNLKNETALITALKYIEDEKTKIEIVKILTDSISDLSDIYKNYSLYSKDSAEATIINNRYRYFRMNYITNILNYMGKNLEFIRLFMGGINNRSKLDTDSFDIEHKDEFYYPVGSTPLIYATATCNEELVKHLILLGADINLKIKNEEDGLVNALDYGEKNSNKCPNVLTMLKYPYNIKENIPVKDYGYVYKEDDDIHNPEMESLTPKIPEKENEFYKNSPDINVELILDLDGVNLDFNEKYPDIDDYFEDKINGKIDD